LGVKLLNCNPDIYQEHFFKFKIYFIELGVICKLEISAQV